MKLAAILQRIEQRLRVLGLSADAASRMAGKPDAIRNMRRAVRTGKRDGVNTHTIDALAAALKTTPTYLLGSETSIPAALPGSELEVLATERAALMAQIEQLTRQVEAVDFAMGILTRSQKDRRAKAS